MPLLSLVKIEKEVIVKEGEKTISINKSKVSLDIDFEIKYNNQVISNQRNVVSVYQDDLSEVYNSRTFCLYEELVGMRKRGLLKGATLESGLVFLSNVISKEEIEKLIVLFKIDESTF